MTYRDFKEELADIKTRAEAIRALSGGRHADAIDLLVFDILVHVSRIEDGTMHDRVLEASPSEEDEARAHALAAAEARLAELRAEGEEEVRQ